MLRRSLIVASVALNIIFLLGTLGLVVRRGGISYVISRISGSEERQQVTALRSDDRDFQAIVGVFQSLPAQPGATVFVGDSLTAGVSWSELLGQQVLSRGITGDKIEGVRSRIGEVARHNPRQVFLMIGINDLRHGRSPGDVIEDYRDLVEQFHARSPDTEVYIESILPVGPDPDIAFPVDELRSRIRVVNAGLAGLASERTIFVDIHSRMLIGDAMNPVYSYDDVHLTAEGYEVWKAVVSGLVTTP